MTKAIYPGSFDPLHFGHLDVIERASRIYTSVVVAVAVNHQKTSLFGMEERVAMIREVTGHLPAVEVKSFEGLLVDFFESEGAQVVVRGLRAVSDFEYEFQMALMNRSLCQNLETVFMMPGQEHTYVSSRMVKEVASLGGNIAHFVPGSVAARLRGKLASGA